jgi:hypothetical protein
MGWEVATDGSPQGPADRWSYSGLLSASLGSIKGRLMVAYEARLGKAEQELDLGASRNAT